MTQMELASASEISVRSIRGYERGEQAPLPSTIAAMCAALGFPIEFMLGDDLQWPDESTVSFRAMSKMRAAERDMALGEGSLAIALNDWLEKRFELPNSALPDLSSHSTPEEAATSLRYSWGWSELPIPNMIHLLESKGVRVFSLSVQTREVDAFSTWCGDTPFIFLNTQKSAERSRFDAAHELGHLVMHRHFIEDRSIAERDANRFASAFLMPRRSIVASAPRTPILSTLVQLKSKWNVSVAALVYRLHDVGKINDWQYRSLARELGRLGYRTKEPNPSPRETSLVLTKVFSELRKEGITKRMVAHELDIPESKLEQLIFHLTLTSLPGGRRNDSGTSVGGESKLTRVK